MELDTSQKTNKVPANKKVYTVQSLYNIAGYNTGPKVINFFSCSIQLCMKFQLLIKNAEKDRYFLLLSSHMMYLSCCWHFNIYERDKFSAQLS